MSIDNDFSQFLTIFEKQDPSSKNLLRNSTLQVYLQTDFYNYPHDSRLVYHLSVS